MAETAEYWWDGLTERQRAFCEAYVENGGNAADAARKAGYKNPHPQGVQTLRLVTVRSALEKMRRSTTNAAIASREERQSFWSSVLRDQNIDMKDRLKASDLLGKSQADFITRTEVSGPAGGPIKIDLAALTDDQLAALESIASALIPSS